MFLAVSVGTDSWLLEPAGGASFTGGLLLPLATFTEKACFAGKQANINFSKAKINLIIYDDQW